VVVEGRSATSTLHIPIDDLADGSVGLSYVAIGCANPECKRLTLNLLVGQDQAVRYPSGGTYRQLIPGQVTFSQRVIPRSAAKPQPEYIPQGIREDYLEASLIAQDSPKASATLARRCLQGMVRHFGQVAGRTLFDEIEALRALVLAGTAPRGVTIESLEAIDHVRGIGNIGAHMEKDIDLIVAVDPGEAQKLLELIEMLFEDWYVEQHRRNERLQGIKTLGQEKQKARQRGELKVGTQQEIASNSPS
jgi:hypothetical protein